MVERIEQLGLEAPLRQETPGGAQVDDAVATEDEGRSLGSVRTRADVDDRTADAPGARLVVTDERLLVRGASVEPGAGVGVRGVEEDRPSPAR